MQLSAQLIQRASRNSVLAHRTIWSPMPLSDLESYLSYLKPFSTIVLENVVFDRITD